MRVPKTYEEKRYTGNEIHQITPETAELIRKVFYLYRNGYRDREIGEKINRTRASVRRLMRLGGGITNDDRVKHWQNRTNKDWLV